VSHHRLPVAESFTFINLTSTLALNEALLES
jgi:hypothetical protein